MLVTLNEVLSDARKKRYGVGLFNTVNLEMAQGVLSAAEESRSPVIIGTAEVLLPCAPLSELAPMLVPMAKAASVPVVVHFDHGLTLAKIREAMDLGFSSVMYDCSTLSLEENCKAVAGLTREAHSRGVTVEAELGHVGDNGTAGEGADPAESMYTDPAEAKRFCEATGVDALAVAIGTAHGAYRCAPKLDFDRLGEIAEAVEPPLVLHGGSGVSDADFQACVRGGISKINIFTDINTAAAKAAADHWRAGAGMTDLMPEIVRAVKEETLKKLRVFGSAGRA